MRQTEVVGNFLLWNYTSSLHVTFHTMTVSGGNQTNSISSVSLIGVYPVIVVFSLPSIVTFCFLAVLYHHTVNI